MYPHPSIRIFIHPGIGKLVSIFGIISEQFRGHKGGHGIEVYL